MEHASYWKEKLVWRRINSGPGVMERGAASAGRTGKEVGRQRDATWFRIYFGGSRERVATWFRIYFGRARDNKGHQGPTTAGRQQGSPLAQGGWPQSQRAAPASPADDPSIAGGQGSTNPARRPRKPHQRAATASPAGSQDEMAAKRHEGCTEAHIGELLASTSLFQNPETETKNGGWSTETISKQKQESKMGTREVERRSREEELEKQRREEQEKQRRKEETEYKKLLEQEIKEWERKRLEIEAELERQKREEELELQKREVEQERRKQEEEQKTLAIERRYKIKEEREKQLLREASERELQRQKREKELEAEVREQELERKRREEEKLERKRREEEEKLEKQRREEEVKRKRRELELEKRKTEEKLERERKQWAYEKQIREEKLKKQEAGEALNSQKAEEELIKRKRNLELQRLEREKELQRQQKDQSDLEDIEKINAKVKRFEKDFSGKSKLLRDYVLELYVVANAMDEDHKAATLAGCAGAGLSVAGGIIALSGAALAPFTSGASLVATVGVSGSFLGSITRVVGGVKEKMDNTKREQTLYEILHSCQQVLQTLEDNYRQLENELETLVKRKLKESYHRALLRIKNSFSAFGPALKTEMFKATLKSITQLTGRLLSRVVVEKACQKVSHAATAGAAKEVAKRMTKETTNYFSYEAVKQFLRFSGKEASKKWYQDVARTSAVASGVASAVFLPFDAKDFYKEATHLNKGAKSEIAVEIRNAARQLMFLVNYFELLENA